MYTHVERHSLVPLRSISSDHSFPSASVHTLAILQPPQPQKENGMESSTNGHYP